MVVGHDSPGVRHTRAFRHEGGLGGAVLQQEGGAPHGFLAIGGHETLARGAADVWVANTPGELPEQPHFLAL